MKNLLLALFTLLNVNVIAQTNSDINDKLIGCWIIEKVELIETPIFNEERSVKTIYSPEQLDNTKESFHLADLYKSICISDNYSIRVKMHGHWNENFNLSFREYQLIIYDKNMAEDMGAMYFYTFLPDDVLLLKTNEAYYTDDKKVSMKSQAFLYFKKDTEQQQNMLIINN